MLKTLKNFLINKKLYWKLRHLINPKVWEAYYHDSSKERREFYSIYIKEKKLDTIFEFGCASGPNLFHIDKNVTWDFYYFGYDVSLEAIKFARKKIKKDSFFLTTRLERNLLKRKLDTWKRKKFDLSTYDRVLYLLTESEVEIHFKKYKGFMENIIIDDFHN